MLLKSAPTPRTPKPKPQRAQALMLHSEHSGGSELPSVEPGGFAPVGNDLKVTEQPGQKGWETILGFYKSTLFFFLFFLFWVPPPNSIPPPDILEEKYLSKCSPRRTH
jgi:hypothetical protein